MGQPQDGVQLLPSNGSVSGAAHVDPSVSWRPLDWLDVRFAALVGMATSDLVCPLDAKARGRPSSFRGGPAGNRHLGLELDFAVLTHCNLDSVALHAGVEAAWFTPGRAFDDVDGERHPGIGLVRTRLQLDW